MAARDYIVNRNVDIGIVGGAGHVGLPLGLVLADSGFPVTLIDEAEDRLRRISNAMLPFFEQGGEELLSDVLDAGRLDVTTELSAVGDCAVIFVVIGTPIDDHNNPEMDGLRGLMEDILPYLKEGHLVVFRSTHYPGTTDIMCDYLEAEGFTVGDDVYVSYAPERIAQHKALEELVTLPQLIGANDDESHEMTEALFQTFLDAECHRLNPTEAELGKLFTNMWRYLTFATANEFYLIADSFASNHDVNVHRIIDRTSDEYPRFDVPSPGANVGGPCLSKDGWFLVDNIPFNELVSSSYQINEGLPSEIIQRMRQMEENPEKVTILGMTYKADSDDVRNSVSFKMRKQLHLKGITNVVEIEPNVAGFDDWSEMADSDWVILMTPHDEFSDLRSLRSTIANDDCLYCDLWGFWESMKYSSDNGYFYGAQVE